jgi:hypothetical protein
VYHVIRRASDPGPGPPADDSAAVFLHELVFRCGYRRTNGFVGRAWGREPLCSATRLPRWPPDATPNRVICIRLHVRICGLQNLTEVQGVISAGLDRAVIAHGVT